MPASAVTSVNSIGPEGRGGVGLGDGDATAAAVSVAGATGAAVGACLQEQIKRATHMNAKYQIKRGIMFSRSVSYRIYKIDRIYVLISLSFANPVLRDSKRI